MYITSYFCVLFIFPFVKCNFAGLNIQPGVCPVIPSDPNLDLKKLANVMWTVSQRSNNLIAGDIDCQNILFVPDGTNFNLFTMFSNSDTEFSRTFHARTTSTTPGIFTFLRSSRRDNVMFKGTMSIPATDNDSFAVIAQCEEILLGYRIITIYVVIKSVPAPPNLADLVTQSLAKNGLALTPPLIFTGLESRCTVRPPI